MFSEPLSIVNKAKVCVFSNFFGAKMSLRRSTNVLFKTQHYLCLYNFFVLPIVQQCRLLTPVLLPQLRVVPQFFQCKKIQQYFSTTNYVTSDVSKTSGGLHMQNIKMMIAGVGGAGCNIVDNMIQQGKHFQGVEFLAINTDVQALEQTRMSFTNCFLLARL